MHGLFVCLFFYFTFLDLYPCISCLVIMCLSKALLIFHFPHILPSVSYHMVIIFLYAGRSLKWISEAELLPFYKEEDKIQKGRREDKDPINSC